MLETRRRWPAALATARKANIAYWQTQCGKYGKPRDLFLNEYLGIRAGSPYGENTTSPKEKIVETHTFQYNL